MHLLTRLCRPWSTTSAYEWAESCDFLLNTLRKRRPWLEPFGPPQREELPSLESGFGPGSARAAVDLLEAYGVEIGRLPPALFLNGFFGPADVAFYWAFIRSRRPRKVIEIGSGYSSRVALRALEKNGSGYLICIDPSPRLHLPLSNLEHVASKIEDVDGDLFADFQQEDILFIDSSHTSLEVKTHAAILDQLPIGALVHYHDIDYPWPRQHAEWDEDTAVNDFLVSRKEWRIVVNGSIMTRDHFASLRAAIPHYARVPYRRFNALWMTKEALD
jgi:predicted O-methyltransferase YrrM